MKLLTFLYSAFLCVHIIFLLFHNFYGRNRIILLLLFFKDTATVTLTSITSKTATINITSINITHEPNLEIEITKEEETIGFCVTGSSCTCVNNITDCTNETAENSYLVTLTRLDPGTIYRFTVLKNGTGKLGNVSGLTGILLFDR